MNLLFNNSTGHPLRKNANGTLRKGQYHECPYVTMWGCENKNETYPYTLTKLQNAAGACNDSSFIASDLFIPALAVAFSEDAPYYDPAYKWAFTQAQACCFKYQIPAALSGKPFFCITMDFFDGGGCLAEYTGEQGSEVLAFADFWNNPNSPVLFGGCITTTQPGTPNAAGTPVFNVDMNAALNASYAGGAGITGDLADYWPIPIGSDTPYTVRVQTAGVLSAIQGASYLYITLKPVYIPEFFIPANYSRVLHKQTSTLQAPWVYIYA